MNSGENNNVVRSETSSSSLSSSTSHPSILTSSSSVVDAKTVRTGLFFQHKQFVKTIGMDDDSIMVSKPKKNILNHFTDKNLELEFCRLYYATFSKLKLFKFWKFKAFFLAGLVVMNTFVVVDLIELYSEIPRTQYIINASLTLSSSFVMVVTTVLFFLLEKQFEKRIILADGVLLVMLLYVLLSYSIISSLDGIPDTIPTGVSVVILGATMVGIRTYLLFIPAIPSLAAFIVTYSIVMGKETSISLLSWALVVFCSWVCALTVSLTMENKFREFFLIKKKQEMIQNRIKEKFNIQKSIISNVLPQSFVSLIDTSLQTSTTTHVVEECSEMIVVLSDFVNFTEFCSAVSDHNLITILNVFFTHFDNLCSPEYHNLEKVKTIGDAFLGVDYHKTGGENCLLFGLNLLKATELGSRKFEDCNLGIRVGLAKGRAYLVVMGGKFLTFDVFGPAVESVEYLESTCEVNKLHTSANLKSDLFESISSSSSSSTQSGEGTLIVNRMLENQAENLTVMTPEGFMLLKKEKENVKEDESNIKEVTDENVPKKIDELSLSRPTLVSVASELGEKASKKQQEYRINYPLSLFCGTGDNLVLLKSVSEKKNLDIKVNHVLVSVIYFVFFEISVVLNPGQLWKWQHPGLIIHGIVLICSFLVSLAALFVKNYVIQIVFSLVNSFVFSNAVLLSYFFYDPTVLQRYYLQKAVVVFACFINLVFVNVPFPVKFVLGVLSMLWFVPISFIFLEVITTVLLYAAAALCLFTLSYWIISTSIVRSVRETKLIEKKSKILVQYSKRNNELLQSFLPGFIINRITSKKPKVFYFFDECSVLFYKILTPKEKDTSKNNMLDILDTLSSLFVKMDALCESSGCMKIKSIGNVYIVASVSDYGGLDCKRKVADLALLYSDLTTSTSGGTDENNSSFRIGINHGSCTGGVVGLQKYMFDIFGDNVNVSSRMCSLAPEKTIQVSKDFMVGVEGDYEFKTQEEIEVKGKGRMETYLLLRRI